MSSSVWTEPLGGGKLHRGRWRKPDGSKGATKKSPEFPGHPYGRKSDAKAAAQEAWAKAWRRAAANAGTLPPTIKWAELWELIREDRTFNDTDTAETEASIVRAHLGPKWGDADLNNISHVAVKKWVDEEELKVRPGMSPGYVRRIFGLFSLTMTWAAEKGIITGSPCTGIKLPKQTKTAKPYLTPATSAAYREKGRMRSDYADALDFDLETGLRPGELCGLHADRCDLDRGWMLVAEVFVTRKRVIRPFPKDGDTRMVPLTDKAIEIIERRLDGRDLSVGCGVPHSDDAPCSSPLVFLTDLGRVMSPDGIRYHMVAAAKRGQTRRRSPYSGRRGWATRAADGGLDAFQIAEILGHATLDEAQGYVQQTPAARMKLSAALDKYPQLTLIEGQGQSGAAAGANSQKQATQSDAIDTAGNAG